MMIRQTALVIVAALLALGVLLGVAVARAMKRGAVCCYGAERR